MSQEARRRREEGAGDDVKETGGGNLIPVPNYMDRQLDSYIFTLISTVWLQLGVGNQATTNEE